MIDLIAGRYTVRAGFGAAFDADNVGGNMLGLGISLTRANLGVSVRSFDFTTGTLPAGVTFTRAGTATYFDANGVLQTAAADQPRFDHDPVTKAPKGLLIEGSRTNLLTYSSEFDNAAWPKTGLTPSANVTTAPDGTLAADRIAEDTSTGFHRALRDLPVVSGQIYSQSFFVKAGERTRVNLHFGGTPMTFALVQFNLATGTVVSGSGEIDPVGGGWYRISSASNAIGTGTGTFGVEILDAGGNRSYTGDGTSGIYVWGAQLEAGAFPSSYIPTTTAAATRAADTAVMTGANFSRWFNPLEGTIAVDFSTFNTGISPTGGNSFDCVFDIDSAAADNSDYTLFQSSAYPGFRGHVMMSGVPQTTFPAAIPLGTGALVKYGIAYKTNDFAASYNGGAALVDAAGTLPPAPGRMSFGSVNGGVGSHLFGHFRRLRYWPTRISNARLQEITA